MNQTQPENYKPHPDERFFDLFSVILLLFAMIAAAMRLSATAWAQHLEVVQGVVFFGVLLGLAVGKSIFSPRSAFLLGLDYGLLLLPWQLGLILFSPNVEWQERVVSMAGRLWTVLGDISRRDQVTDNILFLYLMAILFWCLSTYAGYILVRRAGMWRAVVPMGITALVIETFDPLLTRRSWFLAIYLFLALLLVARMHYLVNSKRWRDVRTYIPSDAGFEQTRIAVGVVLVLVLLSWNIPTLAEDVPVFSTIYRNQIEPFRQKVSDRMSFLFSSLRESVGLVYDYYSDQMILGSGTGLSEALEMTVEAPGSLYLGQRFYWRARVYDTYETGEWRTSITANLFYQPSDQIPSVDSSKRIRASFRFRPAQSIMTIYSTGQPVQFSRAGELQAVTNLDGTLDLVAFKSSPYIRAGEVYEVTASLPSFTEVDLRSAGEDYPAWVTDRYLQLPEEITPRTIELARQIAANYDNPYDIASAITSYIRSNIDYVETLDESPRQQEPIDWFLFDYRKGFCNYYATAEVILLRSVGIPARLAVGYAQGEGNQLEPVPGKSSEERFEEGYQTNIVNYTVRQKNAHAWPEVFFPGLGWVEFEPTTSEIPIFRPSGEPTPLTPFDEELPELGSDKPPFEPGDSIYPEPEEAEPGEKAYSPFSLGLGIIAIGIAMGIIGFAMFARQRKLPVWNAFVRKVRIDFRPLPAQLERSMRKIGIRPPKFLVQMAYYHLLPELSKAYIEIDRALHRLGKSPHPSQTPSERASELARVLPAVGSAIDLLIDEYQLGTYSPYPGDATLAQEASIHIRQQSRKALLRNTVDHLVMRVKRTLHIRG